MRIPGRLKDTTLGDVLGTLWREQATGSLELIDKTGRTHRIELRQGLICNVVSAEGPRLGELLPWDGSQLDDPPAEHRLGERLLLRRLIQPGQLSAALRSQNLHRLEFLFGLSDADLRFRVPRPHQPDPTAPPPLHAQEFLPGRPRHRRRRAAENNDAQQRRRHERHQVGAAHGSMLREDRSSRA